MKKTDIICAVLFAALFPFFCVSSSYDPTMKDVLFGYFGFWSSKYIFLRYVIIFVIVFILTAAFSNYKEFLLYCFPIELFLVLFVTYTDTFISHRLLYNYNYILWLCVTISVTCAAVFISSTLFMKENYKRFFKVFWRSYLFVYLYLLYDVFYRPPNSFELSVNLKAGHGMFRFFSYMVHNLGDGYMILIWLGNLLVFLPIPFLIKSIFPKANNSLIIVLGICAPLIVESYQYIFKCGNVDIDDIILNYTGFIIGFILFKIIEKYKLTSES